ncbi:MAG TPA: sigma-70 family RNA polymerase sigma factor [Actinocrinis sp.]|jgi:RNA polymerase sigma-70 factor (ECF subfamily)
MATVSGDVLERAQAGDEAAFRELTDPHRRELHVHCYRMLGSFQDAEDLVQETLVAAWRGLGDFAGRASLRTWLYRIATNQCLNALRTRSRRPAAGPGGREVDPGSLLSQVPDSAAARIEPYPDLLLEELPADLPGPDACIDRRESVALAFVTAVQTLPPRQRAVLVLRDVLGYRAAEAADLLETSEPSVNSALLRARATLAERDPAEGRDAAALPDSPAERRVVDRFVTAFERGDVEGILALLTDGAVLAMPPLVLEYRGFPAIGEALWKGAFRQGRRSYVLVPTRANGWPAFGYYTRDPKSGLAHGRGVIVLCTAGSDVSEFYCFPDAAVLDSFGLPRTIPDPG